MVNEIIKITQQYQSTNKKSDRKKKGQFFTSLQSARLMAEKAAMTKPRLSILDPGCGSALLSASLIQYCVEHNICNHFDLTLVETDSAIRTIIPRICTVITDFVQQHHGNIHITVVTDNFITHEFESNYDVVICNPPYMKLNKKSDEANKLDYVVYGQPNLYGLFMAKALELLNPGGRFVFITPRSWTSGLYYKRLREVLFQELDINDIYLFQERVNVFSNEDVLQETMITVATKSSIQTAYIIINTISANDGSFVSQVQVPAEMIKNVGVNHNLLLPTEEKDIKILVWMSGADRSFLSAGYLFKTGPVVEFRNKDSLYLEAGKERVPMFRAANVINGHCVFPAETTKHQYVSSKAPHLLVPNYPTIFVKRITAKEETKRIQCCVYKPYSKDPYISVENHLNYLVRTDGQPLSEGEISQIYKLLSSDMYDSYYRIMGGSTQVNASELNAFPIIAEGDT